MDTKTLPPHGPDLPQENGESHAQISTNELMGNQKTHQMISHLMTNSDVSKAIKNRPELEAELTKAISYCKNDPELMTKICHLTYENVQPFLVDDTLSRFNKTMATLEEKTDDVFAQFKKISPRSTLTREQCREALVSRLRDLLISVNHHLSYAQYNWANEVIHRFDEEDVVSSAVRALFLTQSLVFKNTTKTDPISLRDLADSQKIISEAANNTVTKTTLLHALDSRGMLAPIPEIFWEVDRQAEDYKRRLGLDITQFLKDFADSAHEQTCLEFGPGNGTFAESKAQDRTVSDNYAHFGMCDKLYYPLVPLIKKSINWELLQKDAGASLTNEERNLFCDFLYKIIMILPQTLEQESWQYDRDALNKLKEHPNEIQNLLAWKAYALETISSVPALASSHGENGKVTYRSRIPRPESHAWNTVSKAFGDNPRKYINSTSNVYDWVPAYPPGVMISDFKNIRHLKDKEIDVAIGVRSTVYVRNKDYVEFMTEMSKKLTDNGFYIDDNIRDNDGWYYRIAELLEAREGIDLAMQLHVVMGPALEKEDHLQTAEGVPLAVVMTKDKAKLDYMRAQFSAQAPDPRTGARYRLVTLEDLAQHDGYLQKLDTTGKVADSVRKVSSTKRKAA